MAEAAATAVDARLQAAESLGGSTPLVSTLLSLRSGNASLSSAVAAHETRLLAAEGLTGVTTSLTSTVNGLSTNVTALSTLTGSSALVSTVLSLRSGNASLTSRIIAAEQVTALSSPLANRFITAEANIDALQLLTKQLLGNDSRQAVVVSSHTATLSTLQSAFNISQYNTFALRRFRCIERRSDCH